MCEGVGQSPAEATRLSHEIMFNLFLKKTNSDTHFGGCARGAGGYKNHCFSMIRILLGHCMMGVGGQRS